ncbi:MAG: hypothetical protein RJA44_2051 [Pseudomonadota bacterium]
MAFPVCGAGLTGWTWRSIGTALLCGLGGVAAVQAAPLDALLDAEGPLSPALLADGAPHLQLELAGDLANSTVDVLHLRSSDPAYAGTKIGNYHGSHLRAALGWQRLTLQGSLWQRRLQDRSDLYRLDTWQLATQWRLTAAPQADDGALALRASVWGNRADQLVRNTSTRLTNSSIDTQVRDVLLQAPRDRQTQLDLIGSQRHGAHLWSGFAGLGRSRITNQGVSGHSSIGSCPYLLDFGPTDLVATPTGSCAGGVIIEVPNALLPYAALPETNYSASYLHAGASYGWQSGDWGLRLGYEFQRWQRPIDDLIRQRGGVAYTDNHILIGEGRHALGAGLSLLLRGQLMRNQFVGELPLAYNSISASRFGKKYGLVSFGLQAEF